MPCRAVRVRRGADADTVNRPRARRSVTLYAASKTTASEGLRTGTRNWQAMQSGTHFAKTGGFRLHGTRLFHACWGVAPIPSEHKNCVLERWINPSAARFCKSLMGGQLSAALPLFPVVHSLPHAPVSYTHLPSAKSAIASAKVWNIPKQIWPIAKKARRNRGVLPNGILFY